ncbi:class I SAM-dependent methyltransferase [Desulfonema ishimotonii]|uniref:Class I SAM-dependent methyltransferase n=1 Tax=Desulfonema ishimotonii TaxID=45657 RepID=A0A401FYI6_9BACT|nr:class I SAM-dependent methyltransferase [Desulfonema ishimotonii]GBC62006.1 class I SAM-dependent methyltransferase [Desulfonema ishimotonii]
MEKIKFSIRRYWNWRSQTYGHDADKSPDVADRWASALRQLVSEAPGSRALDIGTGTGQCAAYLARSGFDVTGIDLSEEMVARAGAHARQYRLPIRFQTGDAEAPDFPDSTFDVVVARNLLWTLPRPERALREWRRILRPDGILVVSDGFWMNTTWRRAYRLAFNAFRRMFGKGNGVSVRFFCTYVGLQRDLPFYEGICAEDACELLRAARFREIRIRDAAWFGLNPYGKADQQNGGPPFFIATARG